MKEKVFFLVPFFKLPYIRMKEVEVRVVMGIKLIRVLTQILAVLRSGEVIGWKIRKQSLEVTKLMTFEFGYKIGLNNDELKNYAILFI